MQNNRSVVPEGPCDPRESRVDSGEVDAAIGAFSGLLAPLPAPHKDALHPHAVILSADEPANPQEILRAFERSLTGDLPNSAHDSQDPRGQTESPESIALVVGTSGSTGAPKQTALSVRALRASARATERFFADYPSAGSAKPQRATSEVPAQWLLALPAHYVAGAQVLARSALAGTTPVVAASVTDGVSFTPEVFLNAAERLSCARRFVSLVPTQVHKLLEAAEANPALGSEIYDALGQFTGILLGGAPASASLLAAARELGLNVVTTYGSAETAGGCVYSGVALPGVRLRVIPEDAGLADSPIVAGAEAAGRIWLGGEHLASGYMGDSARTASHFFVDAGGCRWYRTDDYSSLTSSAPNAPEDEGAPMLNIVGRSDDVIITGGVKISARAVAAVLESHPAVREAAVMGIPDARWGSAVAAAITLRGVSAAQSAPDTSEATCDMLREFCTDKLGAAGAPKFLRILADFPTASTGKPDLRAIYSMLYREYTNKRG
ncbi:AMP-binding protein [Rothia sp. HMSC071F11]|uniref:AMP-binding protein n=1 Tax=Rothia sp. HMSC071F11 TaxID=1715034 RepID=UPI0008A2B590|nr:AMP-binding protein [Rothia sp. HMSC071F11]OFN45603.1 O-succinylbenzoic acid--CoA ligase [Rothia sp. HMSC071F11]